MANVKLIVEVILMIMNFIDVILAKLIYVPCVNQNMIKNMSLLIMIEEIMFVKSIKDLIIHFVLNVKKICVFYVKKYICLL